MIANAKYKINTLSKDLGLKANDIVNILKAHPGDGAVHTSSIDEDDFAVIFEVLTTENQISGLEDYLAGRVDVAPEHRPAPKPKKKAEEKPKTEDKPKTEEKAEKPADGEKKPEHKNDQPKTDVKKPEQKKPEQKQEQKPSRTEQFQKQQQKQQQQKPKDKDKKRENRPNEKERQSKIITQSGGGHGDSTPVKSKTRIIDTRSANVDLGKYDEHLDSFISERDSSNYSQDRQNIKSPY